MQHAIVGADKQNSLTTYGLRGYEVTVSAGTGKRAGKLFVLKVDPFLHKHRGGIDDVTQTRCTSTINTHFTLIAVIAAQIVNQRSVDGQGTSHLASQTGSIHSRVGEIDRLGCRGGTVADHNVSSSWIRNK